MLFRDVDPPRRYFTPDEANAMLPRVRKLMSRAAEHQRRIRDRVQHAEDASKVPAEEIEEHRAEAMRCIEELTEVGVEVKGLDAGLVDFPALRNGEYVYLCWRVGEPRVEWWHPLSTGFAGRQRVTKDPSVRWEWRN
ncbi:MAG: DUF2203 domain-containing protein [Deltaproteobacteria bacterium]|jgi:hypothetical protein